MNTSKFLMGTLAGGVAFFFLGFLGYAVIFDSFLQAHAGSATGVHKEVEDMAWWALILGNLLHGALFAYIYLKWANIKTFGAGFSGGIVVGFFVSLGMDFVFYATSNMMDLTGAIADGIIYTVICGLAGGIVGLTLGMGKEQAA